MATDSIMGLFQTPEQYQLAQQAAQMEQARAYAAQDPMQRAVASQYFAGGQLGRALGGEDPQLKIVSARNQLAQGKDLSTSEGWATYAKELQAAGDLQGAVGAAQKASELQIKIDEKRAAWEAKNATELAKIEANKSIAQQREENKMQIARMEAAIKGGLSGVQGQIAQEKLDALREKKTALEEARQTKLQNSVDVADNALQLVKDAKGLTTGLTTGITGSLGGVVPGTSAYVLQSKIDTIKAQLGFGQLQAMRDASPTGGALGQVSNQEIKYLQAAIANLDRGLPPAELRKNLDNIEKHYTKWREAAMGKMESAQPAAPSMQQPKRIKLD